MIFKYINLFFKANHFVFGWFYLLAFRLSGRVIIKGKCRVIGVPVFNLEKRKNALSIGANVTLNSYNYDYHANMLGRVKIFIEGLDSSVEIGDGTRIHGSCIHARKRIKIGSRCLIAANCNIVDSNGHESLLFNPEARISSVDEPKEILIEDDVWIGMNSIILPGTTIGKGAIVAANSVVRMNVPPKSIVCGNPAVIVKISQE